METLLKSAKVEIDAICRYLSRRVMKDEAKLRTRDRAIYGTGYLGVSLSTFAISTWLATFYLPPEEGSRTIFPEMAIFGRVLAASYLFGLANSLGRFVDAISDPVIGYFSDNTRSRWGRRRPYIIFGTPPLVITFILAFSPTFPTGHPGNFYHLLLVISFFYLFYTVVITPYLSLLPEIARTTMDRLNLAGWQTIFNVVGIACAVIIGDIVRHFFGFRMMAAVFGVFLMVSFLVPGFKTRETAQPIQPEHKMGFLRAILETLRNRPFLIFLAAQVFIWFGFSLMMQALRHVVVALMGLEKMGMAICLFLTLVVAVAFMPIVFRLTGKVGKKRTYIILISIFVPLLSAIYLLKSGLVGGYSVHLGLAIFALVGIPTSAFFLIPASLIGEIIDYDAQRTGRRREAIYYSTQALINKTGLAFSSLLLGFLFAYGFTVDNPLGIRLLGPTAGAFVFVGLIIFLFYPLEDTAFLAKRGKAGPDIGGGP